ncbi:phytoene desaturase family protein [Cellulomonas edaphi]|uniref:Phytoene desaturase family protein n=1 Tax=Cellulomonas edaphi TaxID=3053468 RepID=A0ABT7S6S3_9CELL|nr:phytoene desaturase family protein [Cellulomons edaphi]MDM7831318.1 phytoene desaturase family protein [Cellulomons edaphi]
MSQATTGRRAVVIGAGIAGLATAALLARDGYDVEVLEQRDEIGGRAGVWEAGGFRFDTGPSWYLMPEVFDHFFALFGTTVADELDLVTLDPAYRVFFEGEAGPLELATGRAPEQFERLEPGAGAALSSYLESAREAYGLALDEFLYTTFTSPRSLASRSVLRRAPRLARLLTTSLETHVARRFTDRRLRQVLGYPAVFLGTSPERAPSLYHLMSHCDLTDGVRYPMGGFGQLIDAVARVGERAGVRVRTGARVTGIEVDEHRAARGVTCVVDGVSRTVDADVVVGAGDLHDLETRLLPAHLRTYPETWWAKRDPGPGAVLVYLGVRGRLPQLAHHSMFFTADWRANFGAVLGPDRRVPENASLYVCAPSRTDASVAPAGMENVFVLVPVPADVSVGAGGVDGRGDAAVERVADAAIARIAAWAGIPDLAERVVVRRTVGPADFARDLSSWSGGALGPAHTLRQSAFLRGRNASAKVSGLLYAGGSTLPGIGLPMCLISAENVAKRLRGDRSSRPLPEPVPSVVP